MDKSKWHLRPGTQDEFIYNEVYIDNCYKLPDGPESLKGKTVIDVGANIGAFTIAALERGAYVTAYEPDRESFEILKQNVEASGFSKMCNLYINAVVGDTGSVNRTFPIQYIRRGDTDLTGGKSIYSNLGPRIKVPGVMASQIIPFVYEPAECNICNIWLKLDCEGAEYEILLSDLPWTRIERIFGEVHHYRDNKFSRDTEEVQFTPIGEMDGSPESLARRLSSVGYSVNLYPNPDDDRLSLFFAEKAEFPLVTWHIPETASRTTVCVLTPFRNATSNLKRYFTQLSDLRNTLQDRDISLRLVAAEGDSTDNTRERIVSLSQTHNIDCQIVDTTHGQMRWGSVEDPRRMQCMSDVMNKALDAVRETDDIVVWIMSDLEWKVEHIVFLVDCAMEAKQFIYAPLALNGNSCLFYDTWAYRYRGQRFFQQIPYHKDFDRFELDELSIQKSVTNQVVYDIDSAGTCLVMSADIARTVRATDNEAVSFCAQARAQGYSIRLSFDSVVRHKRPELRRMLYIGDVIAPTGFSRVTQALLPEFASQGYAIDVVGVNYHGQPHNYPYRIWPANVLGQYPFGEMRTKQLLSANKYDVIFWLGDPWNIRKLLCEIQFLEDEEHKLPPIVAYLTVDSMNHNTEGFEHLAHVICCTQYGVDEIQGPNVPCSIVPFGVNHNIYYPRDRQQSRRDVTNDTISSDAFIVGFVGKNQSRKRLDLALEVFADMVHTHDIRDAYLYFCCGPEMQGAIDIGSLVQFYGLQGKVLYNNQVLSDDLMAQMYSAFDVLISTSQGEGFGLTTLEAMACGVPCVVPDNSAYGVHGWIENEAIKIPCTSKSITYGSGQGHMLSALGEVMDVQQAAEVLHDLYTSHEMRDEYSKRGIHLASKLAWQDTANRVVSIVNSILDGD